MWQIGVLTPRSGRAPNSTETQKELKRPKSDSKVTPRAPSQSDPKSLKSDLKVTQKWGPESLLSHFWVTSGRPARVTFESLLGHFNSFWVSVELGARPLLNSNLETVHILPILRGFLGSVTLLRRLGFSRRQNISGRKKQPKDKVFGQDIPGTSGTHTSVRPGQKLIARLFFLLF